MKSQAVQNVQIAYFSGTGGTARAASCFEKFLRERGANVSKTEIRTGADRPFEGRETDLLIILFAVHALNAPEPVYEYIADLPVVSGAPAAVISVSGGGEISPNTACRVGTIRRLSRKGYRVVYEQMLVMPSNVAISLTDEVAVRLLNKLPLKVERIVGDLLAGTERRTRPLLTDRVLSVFAEMEKWGAYYFGRSIRVSEACISCGWCVRNCPRVNIRMEANRPQFDMRCVFCLRCIYGCPSHALKPGIIKFAVLKSGYDLSGIESNHPGGDPAPIEKLAKGWAWKGVRDYLNETETK